jgi:hypothetical protein
MYGIVVLIWAFGAVTLQGQNVGIGTTNPSAKLDVEGKVRADQLKVEGAATSGLILTSDGSSNATWSAVSSVFTDSDDQNLNLVSKTGNNVTIGITGGASASFNVGDDDNDPTNEYQDPTLSGTSLSLTNSSTTVNLSSVQDGFAADNQNLGKTSTGGETRTITIDNGSNTTIDVRDDDDDPSNEYQDLSASRNGNMATVSIGNGSDASFSIDDNGDIEQINEGNDINVSGGGSGTATIEVENDIDANDIRTDNLLDNSGSVIQVKDNLNANDNQLRDANQVQTNEIIDNEDNWVLVDDNLDVEGASNGSTGSKTKTFTDQKSWATTSSGCNNTLNFTFSGLPSNINSASLEVTYQGDPNSVTIQTDYEGSDQGTGFIPPAGGLCQSETNTYNVTGLTQGKSSTNATVRVGNNNGCTPCPVSGPYVRVELTIDYQGTTPTKIMQVGDNGDNTYAVANSWNTFSDRRLKQALSPIGNALQKLGQLKGYTYYWQAGPSNQQQLGVVAQEVNKAFPQAVTQGEEGYYSVEYDALLAPMVQAVNQLNTRQQRLLSTQQGQTRQLQTLRHQNQKLKSQVKDLAAENAQLKHNQQNLRRRLQRLERMVGPTAQRE